jgi:hypothetical protein
MCPGKDGHGSMFSLLPRTGPAEWCRTQRIDLIRKPSRPVAVDKTRRSSRATLLRSSSARFAGLVIGSSITGSPLSAAGRRECDVASARRRRRDADAASDGAGCAQGCSPRLLSVRAKCLQITNLRCSPAGRSPAGSAGAAGCGITRQRKFATSNGPARGTTYREVVRAEGRALITTAPPYCLRRRTALGARPSGETTSRTTRTAAAGTGAASAAPLSRTGTRACSTAAGCCAGRSADRSPFGRRSSRCCPFRHSEEDL